MGDASKDIDQYRKYIFTQVAQVRSRLSMDAKKLMVIKRMEKDELAPFLWQEHHLDVMQALEGCKDDHLGNIAACGLGETQDAIGTPMCLVVDDINLKPTGRFALLYQAAVVIVAALTDEVWADMHREAGAAKPKPRSSAKTLVIKQFSCGDGEYTADLIFPGLTAEKLGKKIGDVMTISDKPYTVVDIQESRHDDAFVEPIDLMWVQEKANQ